MRRIGSIALAIGCLLGADDSQDQAAKKDIESLQGSWRLESVVRNGEGVPSNFLNTSKLVIDGQHYTVTAGAMTAAATFKLDPSKKPKEIDFTYTEGPQKGETVKGIYEVDGDTYRMARGLAAKAPRPSKFEAPADSGMIYVVFKREPASGSASDAAEKPELEKATGVWVQSGDQGPMENANARLIYRGREFEGRLEGKILFTGRAKLDPTKSPKAIDLTLDSGSKPQQPLLGVYELDAENFRGCLAAPGQPRPTKLTAEPGTGQRPFTFRRVTDPKDPAVAIEAELNRFQGTWSYASLVADGKPVPEETLKASRLTLSGNRFTVSGEEATHKGTYYVDPALTPKTIDVTFSEGPHAGKTIKGIYDLTGDSCKVCIALDDQPRPTVFASKPGGGYALEVLRREKP